MASSGKAIRCDCGFEVDPDSSPMWLAEAQRHALQVHGMDFTASELLARVTALSEPGGSPSSEKAGDDSRP